MTLVAQGLESKEIGEALGIATSTVDGYIKSARAKLGGHRRKRAARDLGTSPQSLGDQPPGVAVDEGFRVIPGAVDEVRKDDLVLREATIAFLHQPLAGNASSVPPEEDGNDLTHSTTITISATIKIALLLLVGLLVFLAVMREANELGRPLLPYISRN